MIRVYVEYTNDTSIIERALPTLEKEHQFFQHNRTVDVEVDGETYTLNHYEVSNTQPRPESYREDYITATNESYYAEGGIIYPGKPLGMCNHQVSTIKVKQLTFSSMSPSRTLSILRLFPFDIACDHRRISGLYVPLT